MATPSPAPVVDPPVPSVIVAPDVRKPVGAYEQLLELASGGMAVVYLGRARDGRAAAPLVAIKRPHRHLATDKNFLAMLLDEARLASSIVDENVVRVRELGFHDGEPFIVMDYIEGASLSELWKDLAASKRAFDLGVALRIVLDALHGLHAAHEVKDANGTPMGIVHRDISPHNVLVGSDGRARLTDFGIAQAADRFQQTRTHEVKGKLAYLAPERIDKRRLCTRQSDVFSMAIVLWECLSGRRLFRGDEAVDTLQEILHLPIPTLRQLGRDVPAAVDDALAKALSRDLDVRFATALEFAQALEKAAESAAPIAPPAHVARLVEALYGKRMAERCELVRTVLADDAATRELFNGSGLPFRTAEAVSQPEVTLDALRAIAPPAPSERYVFGRGQADFRDLEGRRTRWALIAGAAAGILIGAGGTLLHAARGRTEPSTSAAVVTVAASTLPSAVEIASSAPPAPAPAPLPASPPTLLLPPATRRVDLRLPFISSRVVVDGVEHLLDPAADTVRLDVPVASDPRHHLVSTALDGSEAASDVVEPGATAKPVLNAPAASRPVGVVRNGFTKLK